MGDVLTREQVAAIKTASGFDGYIRNPAVVPALCDSHEALRARVAELEGEVERVRAFCEVEVVAALRLQLEQSLAEVERLRGVVVESDKDLVANTARKIARDHNMPLKSAEWMMLEALRVVRSNDNRDRDAALARAEKVEGELEVIHAARVRTYEPIYKKNESGHCVRVPPSNEPYGRVFGGFECVRDVEVTGIQVLVSEDGSFDGGVVVPLLRITSQRVTSWIALDTDGMRYLALCCDNAAAYSEGRTL